MRKVRADPASLRALAVERTRLLAGLAANYGAAPPYESVFRENKLPGESSIAVATAYAEAGRRATRAGSRAGGSSRG